MKFGSRALVSLLIVAAICVAMVGAKTKRARNKHDDDKPDETMTQSDATPATQPDHSNDPIAQTLDQAKDEHAAALESAKKKWLDVIDARTKAAENRGDLKTVETLNKAKESVQKDATMGEDVKDASVIGASKSYQGAVKQADQKLNAAYQKAIKEYTKAHQVADAEAVQKELDEKLNGTGGVSTSGGGLNVNYQHMGGSRGVPGYLKMPDGVQSTKDGLIFTNRDSLVRTKDGDFLNRDFTFDVLVTLKDDDHERAYLGIGTGSFEGGYAEPQKSVYMRVGAPDVDEGGVAVGKNVMDKSFDHIRNPGTHMLRVQKTGNSVTFAVDVDYKSGPFKADISRTIPDIRQFAPFLNDHNTFIFFGRGGTFKEVGIVKMPERAAAK